MSVDILLILLVSVLLSALLYDPVAFIFRELRIVDTPDWRKYNFKATPLGGGFLILVVCVIGMALGLMLFDEPFSNDLLIILLGGLALYVVGLVDDLYQLRASIKLLVQLFVSFATILTSNLLLNDFHGLFGLGEISETGAWLITIMYQYEDHGWC